MFGGLAFLIGGNMSVSASGQGGLLLRVDPEQTDALVAKPHAQRVCDAGPGDGRLAAGRSRGRQDQATARALGAARRVLRPLAAAQGQGLASGHGLDPRPIDLRGHRLVVPGTRRGAAALGPAAPVRQGAGAAGLRAQRVSRLRVPTPAPERLVRPLSRAARAHRGPRRRRPGDDRGGGQRRQRVPVLPGRPRRRAARGAG